jgi:hypothetical protein
MSLRTFLGITSLASLLLAGCPSDKSNQDPADPHIDAAVDGGQDDDDGDDSKADAGKPSPGKDAGVMPSADGGAGDPDKTPTDSGTGGSADAGTANNADAGSGTPAADAARYFLPTGDPTNTAAPRLQVDAAGNTHIVYPAFFKGDAFYTYCKGDCSDASQRSAVRFTTDGTVYNALIRLTKAGKPRVLLAGSKINYWAECDDGCSDLANWRVAEIQTHNGDLDVTGDALALDPQDHPRFLIHAYRALYGIGQKTPQTSLAQCDANCTSPESWRYDVISENELWIGSSFQYDDAGTAHIATHVFDYSEMNNPAVGAYFSCSGTCNTLGVWKGIGFMAPYESQTEAIDMHPAISLALTKAGKPRLLQLGKAPDGGKRLSYFQCDADDCHGDNWKIGFSETSDKFDDGVSLVLDKNDHPRFVNTLSYNIALTYCDAADCTASDAKWLSYFVEQGSDIPADQIFLEWNCTIGAWFLHSPSLALTPDGKPRVGYQIRDVSAGGVTNPDPSKPSCVVGTDMTLSRLSALSTYQQQ